MKMKLLSFLLIIVTVLSLTGCKTSEQREMEKYILANDWDSVGERLDKYNEEDKDIVENIYILGGYSQALLINDFDKFAADGVDIDGTVEKIVRSRTYLDSVKDMEPAYKKKVEELKKDYDKMLDKKKAYDEKKKAEEERRKKEEAEKDRASRLSLSKAKFIKEEMSDHMIQDVKKSGMSLFYVYGDHNLKNCYINQSGNILCLLVTAGGNMSGASGYIYEVDVKNQKSRIIKSFDFNPDTNYIRDEVDFVKEGISKWGNYSVTATCGIHNVKISDPIGKYFEYLSSVLSTHH